MAYSRFMAWDRVWNSSTWTIFMGRRALVYLAPLPWLWVSSLLWMSLV